MVSAPSPEIDHLLSQSVLTISPFSIVYLE